MRQDLHKTKNRQVNSWAPTLFLYASVLNQPPSIQPNRLINLLRSNLKTPKSWPFTPRHDTAHLRRRKSLRRVWRKHFQTWPGKQWLVFYSDTVVYRTMPRSPQANVLWQENCPLFLFCLNQNGVHRVQTTKCPPRVPLGSSLLLVHTLLVRCGDALHACREPFELKNSCLSNTGFQWKANENIYVFPGLLPVVCEQLTACVRNLSF